MYVLIAKHNE